MERERKEEVKRGMRSNPQQGEPARVYRPRTLTSRSETPEMDNDGAIPMRSDNQQEHSDENSNRADEPRTNGGEGRRERGGFAERRERKNFDGAPGYKPRTFKPSGNSDFDETTTESAEPKTPQHDGYSWSEMPYASSNSDSEGGRGREDSPRSGDDRRAPRSFDRRDDRGDDRPRRTFDRRDDRGDDRPRRTFDRRDDRGDDRPRRTFDRRDDRGDDRPRRTFDRRDDRGDDRRAPRTFDRRDDRGDDRAPRTFDRRDDRGYDRAPRTFDRRDDRGYDRAPRSFDRRDDRGYDRAPRTFDRRDDRGYDRAPRTYDRRDDRGGRYDSHERTLRKPGEFGGGNTYKAPGSRKKVFNFSEDSDYNFGDIKPDIENVINEEDAAKGLLRLNKYIANSGVCSRREADEHIQNGQITVNGEVVTTLGAKVTRDDEVCFRGKKLESERKVYILMNKPKDYVTTVDDPHATHTVMELIEGACQERVYPVGRLDRNSTGVLLFTNDGELTKRLTHPSFKKKKVYHVTLDRKVSEEDMEKIFNGIELDGERVEVDAIDYTVDSDGTEIGVEIHSGQNRVVRRIFESLNYRVDKLDRVYFAGLTKKKLSRGTWRFLEQKEVNMLKMGRF